MKLVDREVRYRSVHLFFWVRVPTRIVKVSNMPIGWFEEGMKIKVEVWKDQIGAKDIKMHFCQHGSFSVNYA